MQRAPSAPKRTASQRKAAADASAAASSPSASPDSMSDENADAADPAASAEPAAAAAEEPETPRKRARRGSAKALAAAAADADAEADDAASPSAAAAASPKARRKKSGAATPSPKVSRSKSTPAPAAAMDADDESKDPAAADGAAASSADAAVAAGDAEAPVAKKKPRARSTSTGGAKAASAGKKKGGKASAAASQEDGGDEDMAAALSRSASQSSMGGGSQDGDDDGAGGGGGGNYSPHATQLLAVEAEKRANRPAGSQTIMCWNVNGLRAALKNGAASYFNQVDADIIALCEVKADADTVKREFEHVGEHAPRSTSSGPLAAMFAGSAPAPPKYHKYWNCCTTKKGYSGTAIFSKTKPLSVANGIGHKAHDDEGRVITAEFHDYYLVVSYVPNAGQKLERLSYRTEEWDAALLSYLQSLESNGKGKHVVWTGDLNVCHQDKDIHAPKTNKRSAGFTPQERAGFDKIVGHPTVIEAKRAAAAAAGGASSSSSAAAAAASSSAPAPVVSLPKDVPHGAGFIDVYDRLYPSELNRFTYWGHRWSARSTHKGWRLDYFVVSAAFMEQRVHDCWIGSELTEGDKGGRRSDHAPIFMCIK